MINLFKSFKEPSLKVKSEESPLESLKKKYTVLERLNIVLLRKQLSNQDDKLDFTSFFSEKSIQVLFLKEFISDFINESPPSDTNKIDPKVLLKLACRMFSQETLKEIDLEISHQWVSIFEEFQNALDQKELGKAFFDCHTVFPFEPEETRKQITFICRDNQNECIPLVLLLPYKIFQNLFNSNFNATLMLKKTANNVLIVFKDYLFKKKLSKTSDHLSSYFFVQLLDISRLIKDRNLQNICFEKLDSNHTEEYLKSASNAMLKGQNALREGKIELAKESFKQAIKERPTDSLTHFSLGKIAIKEKEYKNAIACFSHPHYFPVTEKRYLYEAEAYLKYAKQISKTAEEFIKKIFIFQKRVNCFDENIRNEFPIFLDELHTYFKDNSEFVNFDIFNQIFDLDKESENYLADIENILTLTVSKLREKLLTETENRISKIFSKRKEVDLLKVEIFYERQNYDEGLEFLNEIQNDFDLNDKEIALFNLNLSKFYREKNQLDFEKELLIEAFEKDKENDEINRSLFLLGEGENLLTNFSDLVEKHKHDLEVQCEYVRLLFLKEDFVNALKHLKQVEGGTYNANVNYFFGMLEHTTYNFERALKSALIDKLCYEHCLAISEYFFENEGSLNSYISLIELFLQPDFFKQKIELEDIIYKLVKKVKSIDVCSMVIKIVQDLNCEETESFLNNLERYKDYLNEDFLNQSLQLEIDDSNISEESPKDNLITIQNFHKKEDLTLKQRLENAISKIKLLINEGESEEAKDSLIKYQDFFPEELEIPLLLAQIYKHEGNEIQEFIYVGSWYLMKKLYSEAMDMYKKALQLDNTNVNAEKGYRKAEKGFKKAEERYKFLNEESFDS
jgi:hypothetical protein